MADTDVIKVNGKIYFSADRVLEILEQTLQNQESCPEGNFIIEAFRAGCTGTLKNMIVNFRCMKGSEQE